VRTQVLRFWAILILIFVGGFAAQAQTTTAKKKHGAIYLSWGYNTEWYTKSTVIVKQDGLGNNYKLEKVNAHDHRGWDKDLLHQDFTIPQYNYRLGYYFNEKQDLAFEINFDHTKYIIADSQSIRLKGTLNNNPADTTIFFAQKAGFHYFLNNGANFLLFNLVKRLGLYSSNDRNLHIDFTGKAGIGPVIPHVQNSFFGKENNQGFQLGGWNAGLETAVRVTFMRYAYFEFSQKVDYARYSHLRVYEGRAKQSFGTYELVLSVGAIIPTSKKNPLFTPLVSDEPNVEKM
jgi:hypothetical protein